MRKEQDRREDDNDRIVTELQKCATFWNMFGGPSLDALRRPNQALMEAAAATVEAQKRWMIGMVGRSSEEGGLSPEQHTEYQQLVTFAEDGLRLLRATDWHTIRDEVFNVAPPGFFQELIPRADMLRSRTLLQEQRQQARLEAAARVANDNADDSQSYLDQCEEQAGVKGDGKFNTREADRFGLDLDIYNWSEDHERDRLEGIRRKPYGWKRAVAQASEVILGDMYVLLELHYDNVYLTEWSEESSRVPSESISKTTGIKSCRI